MISSKMEDRTGKQIRDRYLNILRPNLKKGEWSTPEDALLVSLYYQLGHKWSSIAKYMPGRSEAQVKNRFYSHIKKKLSEESNDLRVSTLLSQELTGMPLEDQDIEDEEDDEESLPDESIASEYMKIEEHERNNVKIERSESESETLHIKLENGESISDLQKLPSKLWDLKAQRCAETLERGYQDEYVKQYLERTMSHYFSQKEVRTTPINEKEVDMVLQILAQYYKGYRNTGENENKKERVISPEEAMEMRDKSARLLQLDTRKAQLEFLLRHTLREMENIQQKKT